MDLPGLLSETRPSLASLRARLVSSPPLDVHACVLHLRQRWEAGQDDVQALAALVPASDWQRFPPETQRELARWVVSGLPVHVPPPPQGLPLLVQLDWTRAALLTSPSLLDSLAGTVLGEEAVRDLPPERVLSSGLLERLLQAPSTTLQRTALGYVRACVKQALLTPALAQAWLLNLAHRAKPALAAEALELLAASWALSLPCPPLEAFLARGNEAASAAIHVLCSRRAVDLLRQIVLAEHHSPRIHAEALVALGDVGSQQELRPLLERALADPAHFGKDALNALTCLRRCGFSPSTEEAYSVLELYLQDTAVEPALAAEVLSSRAETMLTALEAVRFQAPDWPRWIVLLEALATRGARERLIALVESEHERPGWDDAIRALGRMEAFEAEPTLLRRLQDEPEACLFALARLGGVRTVSALRGLLEHAGSEPPAWSTQAARVLFLLDPGPTTLALIVRLELLTPQLVCALPAHASGIELEVLAAPARQPGDPRREEAITAMGRMGGPLAVDALAELLTDPEESIRARVQAALRALGERLKVLGAARPACIVDAAAPGDATLAEALLRRLEHGGLREEELIWLLDALRGLSHPRLVRVVRPLLRQRGSEVRKRVVACLASAGARSISWLVPLLGDDDLLVARQVLMALGEVGARAAAERVADWLDHPNMNLKKTAAEALAHAFSPFVSQRLLRWLSTHDNPGFRDLLRAALRASVGPWVRSRVVAALDEAASPRAFELLTQVLDGELTPADVGALASRQTAWGATLLKLIYGGRISLASGTLAQVDAELARRGLAAHIPTPESEPPSSGLCPALQRAEAARRGVRLKARLREEPTAPDAELLSLLERASESGAVSVEALTWVETRALCSLHPHVSPEARAGIETLLARFRTPFAELALASLLGQAPDARHPAGAEAAASSRWDVDTARKRLASTDAQTRKLAAHVVGLGLTVDAPDLRDLQPDVALAWLTDTGAYDALAEWSLLRSGPEPGVCARALARSEGAAPTLRMLLGWLEHYPAHSERIARALLTLGEEADDAVRALVGSTELEARLRVQLLAGLNGHRGEAHLAFLRRALKDRVLPIRQEAARQLLARGRSDDRRLVLEALLAGALGEDFRFGLKHSEYPLLGAWMREVHTEHELLIAIRLLATGTEAFSAPLLLDAWHSEHPKVRALARDTLRQSGLEQVLPRALPHLRAGQWEWLDVLGGDGALPPALVKVATAAPDAADHWSRAFTRLAGGQLLYAPGLITPLLETLRQDPSEARLQVLARLTDWYEPGGATLLARALGAILTGEHRPLLFDTLLAATQDLPPSWKVRLLTEVARPSDAPAVDALTDAVLEVPPLLATLPDALRSRVEARFVQDAGAGDPERVRRILSLRAESARSEHEKEAVVELLERSLGHRRARVRHHAHRLLARYAPRERYLRATHQLLSDADPHTVRRGIRVLTFGGQVESVQALADLLSHREPTVRRAAHEGLLVLGPRAITPLTKASAHMRPDHREAVLSVLEELRAGQQ